MLEQRYLHLQNQKISYYSNDRIGPPLVMVHGNSSSAFVFSHQLESRLSEFFHLEAIDLPGHGRSDPAPDDALYSPNGYAEVVAEFVRARGLQHCILVGWSLGGHIALQASMLLPHLSGLFIFGTPPMAQPPIFEGRFLPGKHMDLIFKSVLTVDEANIFAGQFFYGDMNVNRDQLVKDILSTNHAARPALKEAVFSSKFHDEMKIIANLEIPLAVIHGENDQIIDGTFMASIRTPTLWRGSCQVIPKSGHAIHFQHPYQFNKLLQSFAEKISPPMWLIP